MVKEVALEKDPQFLAKKLQKRYQVFFDVRKVKESQLVSLIERLIRN